MRNEENYKKWYNNHMENFRKNSLKYYYKNKEHQKAKHREWCKNNKDYCNEYRNEWRHNNDSWKLARNLRARIHAALKSKNIKKSSKTFDLIGCSLEHLKNHLQNTAINNKYYGFDINNYRGKDYHIDHIIPVDAFNLKCSYHQKLCFNWSNLQILSAKENLIKSYKY